ncbi:MAG: guanylate kinase [Candidatus Omnitrophica bacterium]|nr:guanylate kinase [Candidatus Omnitrophota bacterium]
MEKKGRIFVVSAPSGCGKTTICKRVLRKIKGLTPSVSTTTRRPRRGEKNKKDYRYISKKLFKKEVKNRSFLEWEENFGYFYGTPKRFVLEKIKKGKDLLLSIDVKGAMNVKKKFPKSVLIFIKPPSIKELSRRLKLRNTDDKAEIARRIKIAKRELKFAPKYDYIVVNDKLENAVDELISVIKKKRRQKGG